jgi:Integrase zinc binding domain
LATRRFRSYDLLVHPDSNKIMVPAALQSSIIELHHDWLLHPGMTWMYYTISAIFFWHQMKQHIEAFVHSCPSCQKRKLSNKDYGYLPPKQPILIPWHTIHVDLIGPYSQHLGGKEIEKEIGNADTLPSRYALTIVDAATRWLEIVPLKN